MERIQELKKIAKQNKFCKDGFARLLSCNNYDELIDCYFANIDTCLASNFPSNNMFLNNFYEEARAGNIFVNEKLTLINPERAVLLGSCDISIEASDYAVCTIYVKQNSKLHIIASGHAVVMVDALDNAVITVENDNANVTVNLYSKAVCSGKSKVIHKNRETYDIQIRRG